MKGHAAFKELFDRREPKPSLQVVVVCTSCGEMENGRNYDGGFVAKVAVECLSPTCKWADRE